MNPLRQKLSVFMTDAVYNGVKTLKTDSQCAKAIKKVDIDSILKKDIEKICKVISLAEAAKIFYLAARLKIVKEDKKKPIKNELKRIAEAVEKSAEDKFGKLNIPSSCRYLLLDL